MAQVTTGERSTATRSIVFPALWRARWLILGAVVVAGVGGYFVSKSQQPSYIAQTSVVLSQAQSFDPLGGQSYVDASRYVASQASVADSLPVLQIAQTVLNDGTSVGELMRSVSIKPATDTDILSISATAPTPTGAVNRVNAVVTAYRQFVKQRVSAAASDAIAATTDKAVQDEIRTRATFYGDGVEVAPSALPPGAPTSPNPLRDAVLLAVAAGLVAAGLALWRRPGAARDSSSTLQAPVLGSVVVPRGRGLLTDQTNYAMAMVALDYARGPARGPVLVTGAGADSGAAPVGYGLAVAAAAQGRRVLLVDAQPSTRELLVRTGTLRPSRSLLELDGQAKTDPDVLVPLPARAATSTLSVALLGEDESRPVDEARLSSVLAGARERFDMIILQAAPVHTSALAFALAGHADAIVAAVGGKDQDSQVVELTKRLESAQRPLSGLVLTRPARGQASAPRASSAGAHVPDDDRPPYRELSPTRP